MARSSASVPQLSVWSVFFATTVSQKKHEGRRRWSGEEKILEMKTNCKATPRFRKKWRKRKGASYNSHQNLDWGGGVRGGKGDGILELSFPTKLCAKATGARMVSLPYFCNFFAFSVWGKTGVGGDIFFFANQRPLDHDSIMDFFFSLQVKVGKVFSFSCIQYLLFLLFFPEP